MNEKVTDEIIDKYTEQDNQSLEYFPQAQIKLLKDIRELLKQIEINTRK